MKTKSPLKAKPLRTAGQSLNEKIDDLIRDEAFLPFVLAGSSILWAMLEWVQWATDAPPSPLTATALAIILCIYCFYRGKKTRQKIKKLQQGRDGEIAVGQFLERLRTEETFIFHDIIGEKFNIDHVVIHASGIYVIETKTYSKPEKGRPNLIFNGKTIRSAVFAETEKPITQVRANSRWLSDLLQKSNGSKPIIRSVLLFPGWYINLTAEAKNSEVWVLNPKMLPAFIENSQTQLAEEDIHLFKSRLRDYIRQQQH